MNFKYYDFYYTVIKNRDWKENVDKQFENDIISLNDAIIPNHYVRIENRKKTRSQINQFKLLILYK